MNSGLRSVERTGIVLAVLAATGFSFKAIFVKLAYAHAPIDAITLLALRMGFTLPAVLWVLVAQRRAFAALTRRDAGLLVALGILGYYGASILDFLGLQYISAGLERLILFTYPTLTVLIGALALGRPLERRQLGALALSYAGIGLAFAHDLHIGGDTAAVLTGAAFVFASAISYALYSAGAEVAIGRLGAVRFSALAILVSTLATQAHFLLTHPVGALLAQPLPVYGHAAAMALFSTVLPIFWQSAAMQRIGSARAVLIGNLGPILTLLFGWWLLDETLSAAQLGGAALVVLGVLRVTRRAGAGKS
ncbi:DMT family transporter [Zoogloea sp.]|uniref:DMT family transporter n=1 Tax=Zoogloea sp. TaxID=49181 RepID=UPI0035AE6E7C